MKKLVQNEHPHYLRPSPAMVHRGCRTSGGWLDSRRPLSWVVAKARPEIGVGKRWYIDCFNGLGTHN